jgi:ABC-type dipeptide/oligopeptide/nickel transport system ATPase component
MVRTSKLIIADEPTTNLDVTIQAQYLDVLKASRWSASRDRYRC